jgi:hypothetical protein
MDLLRVNTIMCGFLKLTDTLCIWLLLGCSVSAQNLIPNGSFEDTTGCPTNQSQLNLTTSWFTPNSSSPDLYHACADYPVNTLNSYFGFQPPHFGNAHAGLYIWQSDNWNAIDDQREYIEVQLLQTLKPGTCYRFEMFVNKSNKTTFTSDAIGVYFSDTAVIGMPQAMLLPFTPQIANTPGVFFDTLDWTPVGGTYVAQGGEQYLTIGNFLDDTTTTVVVGNGGNQPTVYFYIDDVSLTELTADLGSDTILCQGESLPFSTPMPFDSYTWQDGSAGSTFLFTDTALGNHAVHVTAWDSVGCLVSDTVNVLVEVCDGLAAMDLFNPFAVHPNPSSGSLTLTLPPTRNTIDITDATGRNVLKTVTNATVYTVDLSHKPNGLYIISVTNDSMSAVSKALLIH